MNLIEVSAKMADFSAASVEDVVKDAVLKLLDYLNLKEKQREVILSFVKGNDVFVSLPTGSGKSLCFAVLPRTFDILRHREASLVIVGSPCVVFFENDYRGSHQDKHCIYMKC